MRSRRDCISYPVVGDESDSLDVAWRFIEFSGERFFSRIRIGYISINPSQKTLKSGVMRKLDTTNGFQSYLLFRR